MGQVVGIIINGLALGMAYALIAVGYSLVFGILRLINFSHAAVYTFGSYMVLLFTASHFNVLSAIIMAAFLSGALAFLIDKVTLEPLRKKKSVPIATLVTTVGVSFIIQNVLSLEGVFGSQKRSFPDITKAISNKPLNVSIGNITIQGSQIIMFAVAVALLIILTSVVNKTKIGLAMRATEQNSKAAGLMGINVNQIISFTFFIGGISAAIAGALINGHYQVISPTMGADIGLKAFAAAVVGGIGILHGAVVGGLVIGLVECAAAQFFGSNVRDPMAFLMLILILIVMPNGLFGKKGITKV